MNAIFLSTSLVFKCVILIMCQCEFYMNKPIKHIEYLVFFILSILSEVAFSRTEAQTIDSAANIDAFSMMSVLNMVMGLIVVVALILGLAWILKKYGKLPNNNLVNMKVLGGLSLGTREKALLIEVENTRLLVGVTPGHIQTLYVLNDNSGQSVTSFDETLSKIVDKTDE